MEADIVSLTAPKSQTDPKFQTAFNLRASRPKAKRFTLIADKSWKAEGPLCAKNFSQHPESPELPLVPGTKSQTAEKDQGSRSHNNSLDIINRASDSLEDSSRISIDTKAKVD